MPQLLNTERGAHSIETVPLTLYFEGDLSSPFHTRFGGNLAMPVIRGERMLNIEVRHSQYFLVNDDVSFVYRAGGKMGLSL